MSNPFSDKTTLWEGLGWAAAILALCIGVSTCSYVSDLGEARIEAAKCAQAAR